MLKRVVQLKDEPILFLEAEKKTLDFLFLTRSGGLKWHFSLIYLTN